MAVSYKKLWHILVDRNMKKKDLEEAAGITHYKDRTGSTRIILPTRFCPFCPFCPVGINEKPSTARDAPGHGRFCIYRK